MTNQTHHTADTTKITIHYFFDPMCGWCYGATQLLEIVNQQANLELIYHPGGMMDNQSIDSGFRSHILSADQRIAKETGARFGDAYQEKVTRSAPLILDSFLPIRAILVAEEMGLNPLNMLKAIQAAHYQDGRAVNQRDTLDELAQEMGLESEQWRRRMDHAHADVIKHVQTTHNLMSQFQVGGYPTLIAELNGQFTRLPHSSFYGKPNEWRAMLAQLN
jgi:putative protein-disulfide isomerase